MCGAPGKIRTCDPRIRNPLFYPTELRVHVFGEKYGDRTHDGGITIRGFTN